MKSKLSTIGARFANTALIFATSFVGLGAISGPAAAKDPATAASKQQRQPIATTTASSDPATIDKTGWMSLGTFELVKTEPLAEAKGMASMTLKSKDGQQSMLKLTLSDDAFKNIKKATHVTISWIPTGGIALQYQDGNSHLYDQLVFNLSSIGTGLNKKVTSTTSGTAGAETPRT